MTGDEIVGFLSELEWRILISGTDADNQAKLNAYAYALDGLPEHIRCAIVDRIQTNGLNEATAIHRMIMHTNRGYTGISLYLETVDAFLKINSLGEPNKHVSEVEMAQSNIADDADALDLCDLNSDDIEPHHYELLVAAHLLGALGVHDYHFRVKHDYHIQLELLRENIHNVMNNLSVVLSQNYKLVPSPSVAPLAVFFGNHPEVDPERVIRIVVERDSFNKGFTDALIENSVATLDTGIL